jgi:ankyrin repeat protein
MDLLHFPSVNKLQYQNGSFDGLNLNEENLETHVKLKQNSAYALHQSILDGRLIQINYFLKMGLKADSKDKFGRTCLMLACLSDHEEYGLQVTKLLIKYGADINGQDSLGRTVVFIACSEQREKLFYYLIDNHPVSIDFSLKDNDGNILLNHVAVHGTNKMLKKVIEKMNERHFDFDQRNNLGYTALLLAIQNDKFLNSYILIKDAQCSISIKDNERYFNALEWLLNRIDHNKNLLVNNQLKNSISSMAESTDSLSSIGGFKSKRLNISSSSKTNLNYKTWYSANKQYYNSDNSCEHTNSPNYSTEHHKSRFVPLILTPRLLSNNRRPLQSWSQEQKYFSSFSNSNLIRDSPNNKDKSGDNQIEIDENTDIKDLIQKLYEIIYFKMSESFQTAKQWNLNPSTNQTENEKQSKNNKTKTRAMSIIQNGRQSLNDVKNVNHPPSPPVNKIHEEIKTKPPITLDENIFNLESMRKTPKLIALQPIYKQSTKEAVHSILDMYERSSYTSKKDIFGGNLITRSKSIVNLGSKEKSNLSERSFGKRNSIVASTRVKFNME